MLTGLMIFLQNPGILQKHQRSITFFIWEGVQWECVGLENGAYDSGQHHSSITVTIKTSPLKLVHVTASAHETSTAKTLWFGDLRTLHVKLVSRWG